MPDPQANDPSSTADGPDAQTGADGPLPVPPDPGGAHSKGYSTDDGGPPVPADGPLPLAADAPPGIHIPEDEAGLKPTGRSEPHGYDENDTLLGAG